LPKIGKHFVKTTSQQCQDITPSPEKVGSVHARNLATLQCI